MQDEFNASAGPRILILEDNQIYAEGLKRSLELFAKKFNVTPSEILLIENSSLLGRFLENDSVDIFLIDLKLPDPKNPLRLRKTIGLRAVKEISQKTNAGIIVVTEEPASSDLRPTIEIGADDYIEKRNSPEMIASKVFALWRRVQLLRPREGTRYAHSRRVFRLDRWRFVIGSPDLTDDSGRRVRLSPTEHAFLRHLCVVEDHEIDRETFNVAILGRNAWLADMRIDSLVTKIRAKLEIRDKSTSSFRIKSIGPGAYQLSGARELSVGDLLT